jgi:predicted DNA-binding WGR domain protein
MEQRSLQYTDSKSDKFWKITLEGSLHTVQYGRSGTAGQTQTKGFATEDAARKSFEKLVAEKLKKGYVEVEAPLNLSATADSVLTVSSQVGETQLETPLPHKLPVNSQELARIEIQQSLDQDKKQLCELTAVELKIERSIKLSPEDYRWVTWLEHQPLPKPDSYPRDRADAMSTLKHLSTLSHANADLSLSIDQAIITVFLNFSRN